MTDHLPPKPTTGSLPRIQPATWSPPPIRTIEDTGLNQITISDLALKILYFGGGDHVAG